MRLQNAIGESPLKQEGRVCHFFRLPPELRDQIYEYAYSMTFEVITADCWASNYFPLSNAGNTEQLLYIPRRLCIGLTISRDFLLEAATVRIRTSNFIFRYLEDMDLFINGSSLIQEYITTVTLRLRLQHEPPRPWISNPTDLCPRLSDVSVSVSRYMYPSWTTEAIRKPLNALVGQLKVLKDLRRFELKGHEVGRSFQKGDCERLFRVLEREVRGVVTRAKE